MNVAALAAAVLLCLVSPPVPTAGAQAGAPTDAVAAQGTAAAAATAPAGGAGGEAASSAAPSAAGGAAGGSASRPAESAGQEPGDAAALARAYRAGGRAAAVVRAEGALVPYGHGRPVLRCAPLRACVVELEAGETVLSTAAGDSERWVVQVAGAGPGGRTPIVVVKPTACDLSTNLVVATDRRLYELALDSPPCHDADSAEPGRGSYNPHLAYTGITRFYYPDELVRRWAREEEVARQRAQADAGAAVALAAGANLSRLNFDYAWRRDARIPWTPAQVFDDGEHTYIVLPAGARVEEAPVLLALLPDGSTALLNYHLERQTYVADRVFERAVLAAGSGKGRGGAQRIEIVNRAWQARRARRGN